MVGFGTIYSIQVKNRQYFMLFGQLRMNGIVNKKLDGNVGRVVIVGFLNMMILYLIWKQQKYL